MRRQFLTGFLFAAAIAAAAGPSIEVRMLSGRPDMVTGGTALVEVAGSVSHVRVSLNGVDITGAFRSGRKDALVARVSHLKTGKNRLEVYAGQSSALLELINHPVTGPVFSGPHQTPFICETQQAGLGPPLDADCSATSAVAYFYKSTAGVSRGFKPLDPSKPLPPDVATTVTTSGNTVDYIVRRERGTINRAIYQIAFLHQPRQPLPDPWTDTAGWNRRLVYIFGGGCNAGYQQGLPEEGLNDAMLSRGYAVATSTLNVFGNNCDDVISAETAVMVKEYFIKTFGLPVHTIGWGGSGGAMQQYLIAQNYPGVLDGIIPSGSFPDTVTLLAPIDLSLLDRAIQHSAEAWTDEEKTAVSGYASWKTWVNWSARPFARAFQPETCSPVIGANLVYNALTNPKGVRCSLQDNQVNVYGRDPATGFARRVFDNVGVQYGLAAFNAGRISAAQFLELNERIGGYDADGKPISFRSAAGSEALRRAYRTGRVNSAARLASIPIIDFREYVDTQANQHDRVRSFIFQARLRRAAGRADNLVILTNPKGVKLVELMDRWLDGIAADGSDAAPQVRVIRNKPAELADACWSADGEKIVEPAHLHGGRCNELYSPHRDPRLVAGSPLTNDVLKCALKPVDPKDYRQRLSESEFARLKAIFSAGVCDYSRPGVEESHSPEPWARY